MRVLKRVNGRATRFGGEQHSGWLPQGATVPLPTPEVVVPLDFALVEIAPGSYILEWEGPSAEHSGDLWYPSLDAALTAAEEQFGIGSHEWRDADDAPQ